MVNKRAFLAAMLTMALTGSASAALAADRSVTPLGAKTPIAANHSPQLNGPMTALFFVGDRVLNVVRAIRGVGLVNLPTRGTVYQTYGIQDGPDGVDPLGAKDPGIRTDGPAPANTPVP